MHLCCLDPSFSRGPLLDEHCSRSARIMSPLIRTSVSRFPRQRKFSTKMISIRPALDSVARYETSPSRWRTVNGPTFSTEITTRHLRDNCNYNFRVGGYGVVTIITTTQSYNELHFKNARLNVDSTFLLRY